MIPFEKLVKALNIYNGVEEAPVVEPEPQAIESTDLLESDFVQEESAQEQPFESQIPIEEITEEGQELSEQVNEEASEDEGSVADLEDAFGDLPDSEESSEFFGDSVQEVNNESESFAGGFDILGEENLQQSSEGNADGFDILGQEEMAEPKSTEQQPPNPQSDGLADDFGIEEPVQDGGDFDVIEEQPLEEGIPAPLDQGGSQPNSAPIDSGEFPPPPKDI